MLDLLLIAGLGFLGSFGHCVGMCGPITVAFSLSDRADDKPNLWQQLYFHGLLNLGRILSYALVGAGIGALGSVLVAGGQLAGVGSALRQTLTIVTGLLLIWIGLTHIRPGLLPRLPFFHPLMQGQLHQRLTSGMVKLSLRSHLWTPALLGMVWGLMPCGFLYAAQIKAAETSSIVQGSLTMLAFGLGTLPTMVAVGLSASMLSSDRRSQLFRLGGWLTLLIGVFLLFRTGDAMTDYSGYAAIVCLIIALVARPLHRVWPALLTYRRLFGVAAFVFSVLHTVHMLAHSWNWNLDAIAFLIPQHRWAVIAGAIALVCMAPAAFTSFDLAQKKLGPHWRRLHLLAVPGLIFAGIHTILIGSRFLGSVQIGLLNQVLTVGLALVVGIVLLLRSPFVWSIFSLEKHYAPPHQK